MASYVPAKYGTEYIFYVGLESVATAGTFQANATLASGDVKLSKNGGTLANLTTLPTVTPASGKLVKVTLSATEMECDNATVIFSDASGGEWRDLIVNIQTATRQIDDLAYGTVSANVVQISGDTTAADNAESFFDGTGYAGTGNVIPTVTTVTNLTNAPTNGDLTATMKASVTTAATAATPTVTAGTVSDKTGYSLATTPPTAAQIRTEMDSNSTQLAKLGTPAGASLAADVAAVKSETAAILTDTAEIGTAGAGLTALASATNLATLAGYVDTEVAAIKTKTDNLPASPANEATLTTIAGYIDTEVAAILSAVDTEVGAIKTKTDALPASPAATGDIPSASSIASAMLSAIMEGSTTVVQGLRIMLSVLAGKSTGGGTTGVAFRDIADSKNRVSATVDADGNRTSTTLDGS